MLPACPPPSRRTDEDRISLPTDRSLCLRTYVPPQQISRDETALQLVKQHGNDWRRFYIEQYLLIVQIRSLTRLLILALAARVSGSTVLIFRSLR